MRAELIKWAWLCVVVISIGLATGDDDTDTSTPEETTKPSEGDTPSSTDAGIDTGSEKTPVGGKMTPDDTAAKEKPDSGKPEESTKKITLKSNEKPPVIPDYGPEFPGPIFPGPKGRTQRTPTYPAAYRATLRCLNMKKGSQPFLFYVTGICAMFSCQVKENYSTKTTIVKPFECKCPPKKKSLLTFPFCCGDCDSKAKSHHKSSSQ